jgi:hypothetical protein
MTFQLLNLTKPQGITIWCQDLSRFLFHGTLHWSYSHDMYIQHYYAIRIENLPPPPGATFAEANMYWQLMQCWLLSRPNVDFALVRWTSKNKLPTMLDIAYYMVWDWILWELQVAFIKVDSEFSPMSKADYRWSVKDYHAGARLAAQLEEGLNWFWLTDGLCHRISPDNASLFY